MNWNEYLTYIDGDVFWKKKSSKYSKVKIGDKVNGNNIGDYLEVKFMYKSYPLHRVIWEMHNGPIPEGMQIDHINHIRTDNRLENLRLVTGPENMQNKSMDKRNKTGFTGVRLDKKTGLYKAQITMSKKQIHLGYFQDIKLAVEARKKAEDFYNFHENHGM